MPKYLVRNLENAPQVVHSICGQSIRVITYQDTAEINIHVTHILDGVKHYHKRSTEVYYVLEGKGKLELDEETAAILGKAIRLISVLNPKNIRKLSRA